MSKFNHVSNITLIGGGDLLAFAAEKCAELGLPIQIILAPRHAKEELPIRQIQLRSFLERLSLPVLEVDDINACGVLSNQFPAGRQSLALCFGPAWIFHEEVLRHFGAGMLNVHPLPLPRYLGGAHFTWQILNHDKTYGIGIQEITSVIDRGDILRFEEGVLPSTVRIPMDYFQQLYLVAQEFLAKFLDDLIRGFNFSPFKFEILDGRRMFFPRLRTVPQAIIDWSWPASDIERFCCAFDRPYPGASTFLGSKKLHLRDVGLERGDGYTHPFCNGLIVRIVGKAVWVAAQGGILVVHDISAEGGGDFLCKLREGVRLYSPSESIDLSRSMVATIGSNG
jgi:methionyl-tRNA formyltransferase